jgi:hypothetical protein
MPLPQTIAMRFTEEDAGYVTVRPVVKQTFRLVELADMVVSVTGKNASRVQQILRSGTVVYNGYRYWWDGFPPDLDELTKLLAHFPDDDPSQPFKPSLVMSISLEIGGGTQRSLVTVTPREASAKKLFHKQSPWQILLNAALEPPPRYEKYSHAEHADIYRLHLSPEIAVSVLKEVLNAAPRRLRKKLAALHAPAALLFRSSRKSASAEATST